MDFEMEKVRVWGNDENHVINWVDIWNIVTGVFFQEGSQRMVITSTDSIIQVHNGSDVLHKLKGTRRSKSLVSASVTADGNASSLYLSGTMKLPLL